jgi:hypothetical protein
MKIIEVRLRGVAPYSQSKNYKVDKEQGESQDDYYRRTWRNHLHTDKDGMVVIPGGGLKNCLSEAAKFLSISVPGKGKSTYTKHFEAGIICAKPASLGIKADDVQCEPLFLPSDGKRGGSSGYGNIIPSYRNGNRRLRSSLLMKPSCKVASGIRTKPSSNTS